MRSWVIEHLKARGTRESVEAIRLVLGTFPQHPWLKWALRAAEEELRRKSWTAPDPKTVIGMAARSDSRLVRNGDELLTVLIESLGRLQRKLHDETPAVFDLWNDLKKGVWEPKDEPHLSDYVKRHLTADLKERGIVCNREVEIVRKSAGGGGQTTDIHVDAFLQGPGASRLDPIHAIIECKGCWNPELNDAMKHQLVGRYLRQNSCPYGLYLVGWFNCEKWNAKDSRRNGVPRISIAEARQKFAEQATSLTNDTTRVRAFVIDAALP
jgi:hypothetical protein